MRSLVMATAMAVACALVSGCGCRGARRAADSEAARRADSIVAAATTFGALDTLERQSAAAGDSLVQMRCLARMGQMYFFSDDYGLAVECGRQELELARALGDTLTMSRVCNHIGVTLRRLGMLDDASVAFYRALHYVELYGGNADSLAVSLRLDALNGIGTVCAAMGDYASADSVLRLAIDGDRRLGRNVEIANNYAELGMVFENRHLIDSAWVCYREAMRHNRLATSQVGVSLSHTHFGRLYQKEGHTAKAIDEYQQAYDGLEYSADRWHWLEACVQLAGCLAGTGEADKAISYLAEAEAVADSLGSLERKAEIHTIYHNICQSRGEWRQALEHHRLSDACRDSMLSRSSFRRLQEARLRYEDGQHEAEMDAISRSYRAERTLRRVYMAASVLAILLGAVVIAFLWHSLRTRRREQTAQQQLAAMRTSFFNNITHEFRTPLTVILGYSKMMEQGKMPPEQLAEAGKAVSSQGTRLLGLINQILDISKVRSAVGRADWRRGDIMAFVAAIVDTHTNMAYTSGVQLTYAAAPERAVIDFVPDYVQKIVCNLVSNAIKFSDSGTGAQRKVIVTASITADNRLMLRVADFGRGMTEEDKKHIFKPFYQAEGKHRDIGSGIGLSLVSQIVDALKGAITVQSEPDKGTVFTVTLPVTAPDGRSIPLASLEQDTATPSPASAATPASVTTPVSATANADDDSLPLVLIVEDTEVVASFIRAALGNSYRTVIAANGEQGLQLASSQMPDIILTDLMMPVMDGFTFCQKVKQSDVLGHIPVIVITAKCSEQDKLRGLKTGVDAYIFKPFNAEELGLHVTRLLQRQRQLRQSYLNATATETRAEDRLAPSDRQFVQRFAETVHAQMTTQAITVDSVASGLCMSAQQLRRKLATVVGETPALYIRRVQMMAARELITNDPALQISDVAAQCGYYDMPHFTRAFKAVFNVTPSAYKKSLQQQ